MILTTTEANNNLKKILDAVDNGESVAITRKGKSYSITLVEDKGFVMDILNDHGRRLNILENKKAGDEPTYVPMD